MSTRKFSLSHLKSKVKNKKSVILGVGNSLKGDDGCGPELIKRLQDSSIGATLFDCGTVPENFLMKVVNHSPDFLFIVDVVDFGGEVGQMQAFKPEDLAQGGVSTHSMSLNMFTNFIEETVNTDIFIIGIQPKSLQFNTTINKELLDSLNLLECELRSLFN